jgi:uncharacterized membrane protein
MTAAGTTAHIASGPGQNRLSRGIAVRTGVHDRVALAFLLAHVAVIVFSTIAMVTILNGPPSPFLAREPNATIMRVAWAWSGPTCVLLGAVAAFVHAGGRVGWIRATALLAAATSVALGAELLGTSTGFPFGEYHYTSLLGYRIGGLVPFPIPISWFYMLYASLAICGGLPRGGDLRSSPWRWSMIAGAILVAWDVSMDPAMVSTAHWIWGSGAVFRELAMPDWLVRFFSADAFYGMPLSNWLGWYVTGTLIARIMLAIVPPAMVVHRVSPSAIPIALYAANGIMPVAICFRDGLWWAALLGTLAMAIPVVLWLRGGRAERLEGGKAEGRKGGKGWDDPALPAE